MPSFSPEIDDDVSHLIKGKLLAAIPYTNVVVVYLIVVVSERRTGTHRKQDNDMPLFYVMINWWCCNCWRVTCIGGVGKHHVT